jgi:hypothetical protein
VTRKLSGVFVRFRAPFTRMAQGFHHLSLMACFAHFFKDANRGTFDYKLDFKFNKTNPTNSF